MRYPSHLNLNRALFIDTSSIDEIRKWNKTGLIDGVTTNQLILLKDGVSPKNFHSVIKKICLEMKNKPVSVELTSSTSSEIDMIREASKLSKLAHNIVVKVPLVSDSVKSLNVANTLTKMNIAVNMTILMTFEQMISAAMAVRYGKKQNYISFFWGRSIEDHAKYRSRFDFMAQFSRVGMNSQIDSQPQKIVSETSEYLSRAGLTNPKIIVGSIRSAVTVGEAFASGANICTVAPDILNAMLFSQRTIETNEQFDQAWKDINKKKI